MAYQFQVNERKCMNCGMCMDLCPVHCLAMIPPSGEGEMGGRDEQSMFETLAKRLCMMLKPMQVAACIGCQICAQECPTHAISIERRVSTISYGWRGAVSPEPPSDQVWHPLNAYTQAIPEVPGEVLWGEGDAWCVAERQETWQSRRSWLGEQKEDLRAPCEAVCSVGTDVGSIGEGRYEERVAIIGSGPTGLSAAYYLARSGYRVTVFEAMPVAGGMMAIGIPAYRHPRAELQRDIDAIRELGVEIYLNTAIGRDVSLGELQGNYDAILLAVGAQRSQRLEIPGEDLRGVIPATLFLKQCNLEPEARLTGTVVVVGGGSTAMGAARSALRAGAATVHMLYHGTYAELPVQKDEIQAALAEGILLQELVTPIAIQGTATGSLQSIRCQRMELGEPDSEGRRLPVGIPGSEYDLAADTVLVAIGEAPDPSFLPAGASIQMNVWGGLLVNSETLATGAPGIFAAGDVTYGPGTIIHAAADGKKAARSIHTYLRKLSPGAVATMPEGEQGVCLTPVVDLF